MLHPLRRELRDLLNPKSKEKLKIRNGKQGTYVQGVKKMAVASYDEIEKVQDVGNSNRTVGATLMNATSSRAHTIVTISLTQLTKEDGKLPTLAIPTMAMFYCGYTHCGYVYYGHTHYGYVCCGYTHCGYTHCGYTYYGYTYYGT